jgi:hypothetical protein
MAPGRSVRQIRKRLAATRENLSGSRVRDASMCLGNTGPSSTSSLSLQSAMLTFFRVPARLFCHCSASVSPSADFSSCRKALRSRTENGMVQRGAERTAWITSR